MPQPPYFPLRWESTGDQWWYASPIDYAAANAQYDLVRELLRLDGNHLIKLTSLRRIRRLETVWDDEEQFHDVAKCRSEVARKLLTECEIKKGKNSLIGAGYGGWLLYTAASAGDSSFVRELLERDPLLVFGEGEFGVTDILYAAARSKDTEVFKVVVDFAESPRLSTDTNFGSEGYNGEIPTAYKMEIRNRAIHAAARGGNLKLLKELIGDCSDDALAYRDIHGATVLHSAAAKGHVEVVKYLTSNLEMITSTDNHGNTALHVAAHRGHISVVEALILASPSLVNATNESRETFLHAIVTGFRTPCFRRLDSQITLMKHLLHGDLFKIEEIINAKNNEGRTPLHLAIVGNTHSDLVKLLMSVCCIDVNVCDIDGLTPLDILRQRPNSLSYEILTKRFISAGGILNSQDYSTRKVLASHIKRQTIENSPGTSFRISDIEIFLHTGIDNTSDGSRMSTYSPDLSQLVSNSENKASPCKTGSINYAARRIKRLLHWPKAKTEKASEMLKKMVDGNATSAINEVPIPLRQRFTKPTSLSNNKKLLSVRSNEPSPRTAKKKLASRVWQGFMQAIPNFGGPQRSSSSWGCKSAMNTQLEYETERGFAKPSCAILSAGC